jgi:translation initiation factor 2B subunit (eIF-2B alpha/beta/delta family)
MLDKMSGAVDIAGATAQVLLAFAAEEHHTSVDNLLTALQEMGRELLTAQSGMASLISLFNRAFFAASGEADPEAAVSRLCKAVEAFQAEQQVDRETLSRKATALLPVEVSILTHSASSTVFRTILRAKQIGRRPRVYCLESRPLYEGRNLAMGLAENGIDVTLCVDSAVYSNLKDTELVLVGADSLAEEGVVAKVGTAGLAVCAQSLGIPCYVLADSTKIWPASLGEQPLHERAPADVWADAPDGVRVQSRFYDVTPWQAVAGVITEHGLFTANEIRTQSRARTVHRLLQNIITEVRSTI